MNKKELYKTIGLIDDDLITEAENSVKLVKHLKISKIAAVAAAGVYAFKSLCMGGKCVNHLKRRSIFKYTDI